MATIGLIEIQSQNHELSGLCKISNPRKNEVTMFTTRALFPYVQEELHGETDGYQWVLNKENDLRDSGNVDAISVNGDGHTITNNSVE